MSLKLINKKYGVNTYLNRYFFKKLGINNRKDLTLLKGKFKYKFARFISSYKLDKMLFNSIKENITFLKNIKSYRGARHRNNYPVRGQRTHTNAKKKFKYTKI